jgi:cyclase
MLKKRVIFTLLYDRGMFMLSRNFRLQKVGDIQWLQKNYDFSRIAFSIDELIVLDVSRGVRDVRAFCDHLEQLTQGCFVPIAAGGGVRSVGQARTLLRSGADKVVINTPLFEDRPLVRALAAEFGQQCIVASVDVKTSGADHQCWVENGSRCVPGMATAWLETLSDQPIGELYLNSINRDGTGQGYERGLVDLLAPSMRQPVILAGGAGNFTHLAAGLADPRVDAVATAHLFNFVGDGLKTARRQLTSMNIQLARWDTPS